MQEVRAENGRGKLARKKGTQKMRIEKFPTPSYWILFNYERRWLGMMTKMKKMNVLIYQVTRFARDNNFGLKLI